MDNEKPYDEGGITGGGAEPPVKKVLVTYTQSYGVLGLGFLFTYLNFD